MQSAPRISVLIPCHSLKYLESAIDSIAAQTLASDDFETILIGDRINLVDAENILNGRLSHYKIYNSENPGIVSALNLGLSKCNAGLIARMDEDDLMEPERLHLQLEYMDRSPNCVALGGQLKLINELGNLCGVSRYKRNVTSKEILKKSPIAHPAAIFKRDVVLKIGGYRENLPEDWDLWARLYKEGDLKNLDDYILRYRIHPKQLSRDSLYKHESSRRLVGTSYFARTSEIIDLPQSKAASEIWLKETMSYLRQTNQKFLEFEKSLKIDIEIQNRLNVQNTLVKYLKILEMTIRQPTSVFMIFGTLLLNKINYLKIR